MKRNHIAGLVLVTALLLVAGALPQSVEGDKRLPVTDTGSLTPKTTQNTEEEKPGLRETERGFFSGLYPTSADGKYSARTFRSEPAVIVTTVVAEGNHGSQYIAELQIKGQSATETGFCSTSADMVGNKWGLTQVDCTFPGRRK